MNLALLISNPPDASALMEASRSFGNYDLAAALADLIDNSITAGASHISIDCLYSDDESYIRIADDGAGMSKEELINAMRPASRSPLEERDPNDLGRFGLGLKTASFSQARNLTVVSSKDEETVGANWDLDSISDWTMILYEGDVAESLFLENNIFQSKTEVIWRKLDRVTENGQMAQDDFIKLIIASADKLSLIFHRYMKRDRGSKIKPIKLYLNGSELFPHDPFNRENIATQELNTEEITVSGTKVKITPYILPHFSKLPPNEYEKLGGEEGYIRNQGFYVYRNKRLIIYGTWFKLFRHGELSKLARVMVDIPNNLDEQWRITVDKSDAQIPTILKQRLKDLTERIGIQSSRVYRQRGSRINRSDITPMWVRIASKGQIKYSINFENKAISNFAASLSQTQRNSFNQLLKVVASCFPVETLHADYADNPNHVVQNDTQPEELISLSKVLVLEMLANGVQKDEVLSFLKNSDPFSASFNFIVEELQQNGIL